MDQDLLSKAEALRREGVAANSAGRPAEAQRLLRAALQVLRTAPVDPVSKAARARVLISQALPIFERRGLPAAIQVLEEAAELADASLLALVSSQKATLLARSGDLVGALVLMDGVKLHAGALQPRDRVVTFLTSGTLQLHLGNLSASRTDLARAAQLGAELGYTELAFKARHNAAYVEYLTGDLPRAMENMARLASEVGELPVWSPLDHGRVLLETGLVRDAQERFRLAEGIAAAHGLNQERGEALVELARASLLRGDLAAATQQARSAKALFTRRGAEGWRAQAELVVVMIAVFSGRPTQTAARRATQLADEFGRAGAPDLEAYALLLAAESRADAGDLAAAEELLARARSGLRYLSTSRRLYSALVRAKVAEAAGRRDEAKRVMRQSADELAKAQGRSASLDVRAATSLHGRRLGEFAVRLAVQETSARGAFEATERWLAISNRLPPVEPSDDPVLAEHTAELRRLRDQVRGVTPERNAASARVADLERLIREREWRGAPQAAGHPTRPVRLTVLQRRLREADAELVSYFSHAGDLWAVQVWGRGTLLQRIAHQADLSELVARALADLRAVNQPGIHPAIVSSVRTSLAKTVRQLDGALLGGLRLRCERLVVVPSFGVSGVPWGMLPSRRARPTTVATSATQWALPQQPTGSAGPSVFATAGPGLNEADREVDAIAAAWPRVAVIPAAQSTEAALVEALRSRDIVHIAAHGEHNAQNPLFSSVRLGDGVLFAYELQRGGVSAQHVILSACDVGRATMAPGDEALGLTASLLALGVRNVVAAVTPVPDEAAHKVMVAYHQHLATGLDASAALALAAEVDELGTVFCSFGADWAPRVG